MKKGAIQAAHPMVFAGAGFSSGVEAEVFCQMLVKAACVASGKDMPAALQKLAALP